MISNVKCNSDIFVAERPGEKRIRFKSYKTELNLTQNQKQLIEHFFYMAIIAHNRFLKFNLNLMSNGDEFVTVDDYFDAIRDGVVTDPNSNLFLLPQYKTTIKKTLEIAENSLKKYSLKKICVPKYKHSNTKHISYYFSAGHTGISCQRHRINIPGFGWVRIKEKGYIPYKRNTKILSGWIKKNCGRYFVSVLVKEPYIQGKEPDGDGIGIDININNFATVSNGKVYPNINKTERVKKYKRKIAKYNKELRKLDKKNNKYIVDGKRVVSENYKKRLQKLDCVYYRLSNIRDDYLNKCVADIVSQKPKYIALETLILGEMLKERRFSKYLAEESIYDFRVKLCRKSKMDRIAIRLVDRYYPSSRICHECGTVNKNLTINDREFVCPGCGKIIMRDFNASLNIRDAKKYKEWF